MILVVTCRDRDERTHEVVEAHGVTVCDVAHVREQQEWPFALEVTLVSGEMRLIVDWKMYAVIRNEAEMELVVLGDL